MNLAAKIPVKCIQRVNEFANTHSVRSWFSCLSFVAKILQKLVKNILTDCNHFNSSSTTVLTLSKEAQVCALSRYSFPTGSHVSDSGACGKDKERHVSNEGKQKWMIQSIKWSSYVSPSAYFIFIWTVHVCQQNHMELNRRSRQEGEKDRSIR